MERADDERAIGERTASGDGHGERYEADGGAEQEARSRVPGERPHKAADEEQRE